MEFLGIGPLELAFIILLAIIIFGPKDIVKTSKTIGASLNKFIRSDTRKTINQTSQELKNLPTRLMREAGLEELEKTARSQVNQIDQSIRQPGTSVPTTPASADGTDAPTGPVEIPGPEPPANHEND